MLKQYIIIFFGSLSVFCSHLIAEFGNKGLTGSISSIIFTGSAEATTITSANLNQAVGAYGTMYEITQEGAYILSDTLKLQPQHEGISGLRISASNVFLDLNNFEIYEDRSSAGTCDAIIEIGAGVSNVTIARGRITNARGSGITINSQASTIFIGSLAIVTCGKYGIEGHSANNITLQDIVIQYCTGTHIDAADGATSVWLANCSAIKMAHCFYEYNSQQAGASACGVHLVNCQDCQFVQCESNYHNGTDAFGFKVSDGSHSCSFKECNSYANKASTGNSYGFYLSNAKYCECDSCESSNHSTDAASAYGFYLDNAACNNIKNCVGNNQHSNSTVLPGEITGFYAARGRGNSFNNCLAAHNTGPATITTGSAIGFALRNGEKNSTITNCVSTNNDGKQGSAYGIMIGSSTDISDVTYCIVSNNKIEFNTGATAQYGYRDFAANSTTYLTNNTSIGHGPVYPSDPDPLTPTSAMNYLFTFTGDYRFAGSIISELDIAQLNTTRTRSNVSILLD